MSFLSTKSLKAEIKGLVGSDDHPVDVIAVVLHVGYEIFVTGNSTKRRLEKDEPFSIPPGQFALLITDENIKIPRNRMGFITIKFSLKKKGLINISGFHVDPGFEGKLLFSVYNAGASTIPLSQGADAFRMWLAELDGEAEEYHGKHQGQSCISEDDVSLLMGRVASPAALQDEVNDIKRTLGNFKWFAGALLIPVVLIVLNHVIDRFMSSKNEPMDSQSVIVVQGGASNSAWADSLGLVIADSVVVFGSSKDSKSEKTKDEEKEVAKPNER